MIQILTLLGILLVLHAVLGHIELVEDSHVNGLSLQMELSGIHLTFDIFKRTCTIIEQDFVPLNSFKVFI